MNSGRASTSASARTAVLKRSRWPTWRTRPRACASAISASAERGRRLVEDHHLGVPHHGLCHGHGLALAAGQAGHALAHGPQRGHRETLQRLLGPCLHRDLVQPAEAGGGLAPEVHVLHHVEVVGEREVLIDDLDPEPRGVLGPVHLHHFPVEDDLALVDRMDAGDALDQRRLARAVVAHQRHDLARRHVEVDLVEGLHGTEALGDAAQLEDRGLVHG
jgi:hypothetical protein